MLGMKTGKLYLFVCLCAFALPATAGVFVNSPTNGSTVGNSVHFVASGQSPDCPRGVAAVGVYTAPGVLAYVVGGSQIDTYITLNSGTQYPVVQEWDNCGWAAKVQLTLNVGGGSSPAPVNYSANGGQTFYNLQQGSGWNGYALLPPDFGICSSCSSWGPQVK